MQEIMKFEGTQVEVLEINSVVYFNPYHVGQCLGLSGSAVRNHVAEMNQKQAITLKNSDVRSKDIRTLNNRGETFLTESGVYQLAFKSKKPDAKKFVNWITDEVLPTIRKTGKYEVKQAPEQTQLPSPKYCYEPKTYHGQVVCTVRDIEHFTGIETHKISSKIHNNKSLVHGTDYWMLEGNDLAYFKSKYPTIVTSVRHLFIITRSGFSKLFGTAPEYAKALPCYNIVQAKSEGTVELPVKTINWAKGMCTDVPENPEAQQLITHIRKVLTSIDMMLDECNMYHRKEEDYKRCAYAAYQLSNRASRLALDLYTFKPKMVEKYL